MPNPNPNLHYHAVDHGMRWDASDPIGSARRMIEASATSSKFRGSPVIACISALVEGVEGAERMAAMAVAAERDRCGKIADMEAAEASLPHTKFAAASSQSAQRIAASIRQQTEGTNRCQECGEVFLGPKRRAICPVCLPSEKSATGE